MKKQYSIKRVIGTISIGLYSLLFLQSHALAQGNNVQKSISLEEVIVTAQRQQQNQQKVPISISAFSGESLELKQIRSLSQLTESVPNLVFDASAGNTGSSSAGAIFIRGVGQGDFVINTDPGVGIYVDGVYLSKIIGNVLDVFDFESVEVLRGPQGTLFGRNTIGGAINITSSKPSLEKLSSEITATLGSTDGEPLFGFKGKINVPLSENVAASAAIFREKQDGWLNAPFSGADLGDTDSIAGRFQLRIEASEDLSIDLAADYSDADEHGAPMTVLRTVVGDGQPGTPGFLGFLNNTTVGPVCSQPEGLNNPLCFNDQFANLGQVANDGDATRSEVEAWGLSATVTWNLDNAEFKSITAYRESDSVFGRDLDGTPIFLGNFFSDYVVEQLSQEFQLSGSLFNDSVDYLAGAYFFEEEGRETQPVNFSAVSILSGGSVDNDNQAIFGQATWAMTDQWSLTAGLRYTEETKRFTPNQFVTVSGFGLPVGFPLVPSDEITLEISETTPLVSLSYQWTEDVLTYAKYSEGFKSGGFTQRYFPPVPAVEDFEPEFVEAFEIGFKAELLDNRLRLNGSIFDTDYKDLQVVVFSGIAPTTQNAAAATIKGAELELTAILTESLKLEASMGFLDAEYDSIDGITEFTIDSDLQNTPEFTFSLAFDYNTVFANGSALNARLDWSYSDEVANDSANTPELIQDDLNLVNALVRYTTSDSNYDISLGIKNLTDELYITSGFADVGFASNVSGVIGEPRSTYLSVTRRF